MRRTAVSNKYHKLQFAITLVSIFCLAFMLLSGCEGPKTQWSSEVRSPDGKFVAQIRSSQPSGIGTGDIGTFVYLNWTSGSQSPTIIVAFEDGSDENGNKSIGINWLTSNHLELTYSGPRTIDFQAVKCHGVEISLRDISAKPLGSAR
jgi:hypothetical protein